MVAFAANSLLCRMALKDGHIDPVSFSNLRLLSGALVLGLVMLLKGQLRYIEWRGLNTSCLVIYIFAFSLAYIHLDAGTGALLLFGAVQLMMTLWGLGHRELLSWRKGAGILLACTGLVALLLPGASSPPLFPALLMVIAGLAWAAYCIAGQSARSALAVSTGNFLLALPVVGLMTVVNLHTSHSDGTGILLALLSGAGASGMAYMLWYTVVPHLTSTTASTVQLSVPCIATLGGMALLGERPDLHIMLAMALTLLGIILVIYGDKRTGTE